MEEKFFSIEAFGEIVFKGYDSKENWNGWACPYFTFEQSQRIVNVHKEFGNNAWYNAGEDAFVFEIADDQEVFKALEFEGQKLYPIGSSTWIWSEASMQLCELSL